jgi:hypothetical protein
MFVDEAHDLHAKTLTGLKRLMEVVADGGGTLVKRHTIPISVEEWNFAAELGQMQRTPVSPSTVLRHAVRLYLDQRAAEIQRKEADERLATTPTIVSM